MPLQHVLSPCNIDLGNTISIPVGSRSKEQIFIAIACICTCPCILPLGFEDSVSRTTIIDQEEDCER